MKTAKILAGFGILAMTVVLIYGFTAGNFSADGAALLANPWGIVSFVDLYTGFTIFLILVLVANILSMLSTLVFDIFAAEHARTSLLLVFVAFWHMNSSTVKLKSDT